MITEEEDFNYNGSSKVEINDGCINCIWLENSNTKDLDNDKSVRLTDGHNALIEFSNGKKMIITNSEWCSLNWFYKNK